MKSLVFVLGLGLTLVGGCAPGPLEVDAPDMLPAVEADLKPVTDLDEPTDLTLTCAICTSPETQASCEKFAAVWGLAKAVLLCEDRDH